MITTDFLPGSPCWLDLGVPDTAAAAAFYGTVLGWEFTPERSAAGGHGLFRHDGRVVGAVGPLTEEGARPAWMLYFHTPDAQATSAAAEAAGGTVRVAPTVLPGIGRMARLTDPLGAEFAVFEPGGREGLEVADQPGTLCWVELYTTDAAAAKRFYGGLFGWQTQDMRLPDGEGDYCLVAPSGAEPERMHGGIMELAPEQLTLTGGRPYWHPVFAVTDCDATVRQVTAGGGGVQMGPVDAPGVGRLALCLDPFGADFVLLRPMGEAG